MLSLNLLTLPIYSLSVIVLYPRLFIHQQDNRKQTVSISIHYPILTSSIPPQHSLANPISPINAPANRRPSRVYRLHTKRKRRNPPCRGNSEETEWKCRQATPTPHPLILVANKPPLFCHWIWLTHPICQFFGEAGFGTPLDS